MGGTIGEISMNKTSLQSGTGGRVFVMGIILIIVRKILSGYKRICLLNESVIHILEVLIIANLLWF